METLAQLFTRSDDGEIKTLVLESLGDLGASETAELAGELEFETLAQEQKIRVLYALTRCGSDKAYDLVISHSQDGQIGEVAAVLLEEASAEVLEPVVAKRLRSEENTAIVALLEDLRAGFEAVF